MSDATTSSTDGQVDSGSTSTTEGEQSKQITMTSAQLAERLERAKPADYDDLKSKAAKYDELADANKSEVERAQEKAAQAEAEIASVPAKVADSLRSHLVALGDVNAEDAELFLTATEPELLLKQMQRLTAREQDRKKQGNHVPREGSTTSSGSGDGLRDFARELFDSAD